MLVQLLPWLVLLALAMVALSQNLWFLPLPIAIVAAAVSDLRHTRQLRQLCVDNQQLEASLSDGSQIPLHILGSTRIVSGWVWLRIQGENGRKWSLLLSTRPGFRNTDRHSLRQLIGWLRLRAC